MTKMLFKNLILLAMIFPSIAVGFSFPEIPFCPEGGPPGWFNRMTGQHNQRYYGPVPVFSPAYPPVSPQYWNPQNLQQSPAYPAVYPATK